MRILLIEDEKRMVKLLKKGLEEEGHTVLAAYDGATGLDMASNAEFEVIILDVMLPMMDGHEVARRLRAKRNRTPILMLTAKDTVQDVVQGLDTGADDYLTKPFVLDELLARLRSLARRSPDALPPTLQVGDLTLDPATHRVTRGGKEIQLTRTEFGLLERLMSRAGKVVPRDTLIESVWGYDREIETNTLEAFISMLRQKIDRDPRQRMIQTVRGIGYSIRSCD